MKKNSKVSTTIACILILVGIYALTYNFINEKREMAFNDMNLKLSSENIVNKSQEVAQPELNEEENENNEEQSSEQTTSNTTNKKYEYYLGKLEIPKINFSRGFYDKKSSLNDVKNNIKVLKESDYPDVDKGNLMIIGHSGNYSNSYFGNLYKLNKNDLANVYYKNIKYSYQVTNIYTEKKDGDIEVKRDSNKTTLTLITCTKDDNYHQTVYILELIDKKNA